ncbi:Nmad3 family putative nucleotide modification protein [Rhodoferax antarcticus]|uniref:Nmad3 family putative nucleotide modification protein n=1 Tax=Rhodoferax antarcticus TaxID=81479 RepID=UPI0022254FBC|nr:hypothetical protein [Rhodoferax antarcticus]MCW2311330.1 hypothetical protein [Rhodoferax antarcticus]
MRVGIDRGCGGRLSPIAADLSFEFVPIPEGAPVGKGILYSDLSARGGGTLADVIGRDGLTHYDPEFVTFSYGEPSHPKRSQLLRLEKGNYLVFYAGFQGDAIATGTCCAVGYLVVGAVHKMTPEMDWPPTALSHLDNAHFRRIKREESLVVVEGEQERSRLLTHAIPISDSTQKVLPSVSQVVGFSGSVMRAVGRWVPDANIDSTLSWIETWG